MEKNPARARWNILKRKIQDSTFFVLTREASLQPAPSYRVDGIDFNQVISQIQMNLNNASLIAPRSIGLNGQHAARAIGTPGGAPAYEQYKQGNALEVISTFMDCNKKVIRRLSKLPASMDLQQLMQAWITSEALTSDADTSIESFNQSGTVEFILHKNAIGLSSQPDNR